MLTREATLGSPEAVSDRVLYADIVTLESILDELGPEAWRALLALLHHHTVVESRRGGRRLGVARWGAAWVQQHTGLGNKPARRAVNRLEKAGLVIRDEVQGSTGGAGAKVGLLDLTRLLLGGRKHDLPALSPTGRRWSHADLDQPGAQRPDPESIEVKTVLALAPTRTSAEPTTCMSAITPRPGQPTSSEVDDTSAETPTCLSTGPSRVGREIRDLLSLPRCPQGLLASGLLPALRRDPADVLDRLVPAVTGARSEGHAHDLLLAVGLTPDETLSAVRFLLETVLIDIYLVDPTMSRTWLATCGVHLGHSPLADRQLAERLVVAVTATLGRAKPPRRLGGWFGAWCKPEPNELYANKAVIALHQLSRRLSREMLESPSKPTSTAHPQHAQSGRAVTTPSATLTDDGSIPTTPSAAPAVDATKLSDDVVTEFWPLVLARFPAAEKWSDRLGSRTARSFLAALAHEQPELLQRIRKTSSHASAPAITERASAPSLRTQRVDGNDRPG